MAKMLAGVKSKLARIEQTLDAIENGKHAELPISYCTDYISWVVKYQKAPREVWEPIVDRITHVIENCVFDYV